MKTSRALCVVLTCFLAHWCGLSTAQSILPEIPPDVVPFTEPDVAFRVQTDALFWARNNAFSGPPVIGGPETFNFGNLSNNIAGGYRVGLGYLIDPCYELEGVWTQFGNWTGNGGGVLSHAVAFNGGTNSTLVDPTGNANFINTGTFFRPIFDAASNPLANPAIQNYAFLNPGGTYSMHDALGLYDVQVNFKTRRNAEQRIAYGFGFRNIHVGDGANAGLSGVFGTNDLPAGGTTHNTLSNQALVDAGLTLLHGAGGFTNGVATGAPPTNLTFLWNGAVHNQMDGGQATIDANILQYGPFLLEGLVRSGLYYNQMTGTIQETYASSGGSTGVYGRTFTDNRQAVSWVSNLGLSGVVQLATYCRFRIGYEAMFLTNTALAANQQMGIVYNSLGKASYSLRDGSTLILQGGRIGLEFIW
jgi:hypothetical protein